jgi:hypothetical protein
MTLIVYQQYFLSKSQMGRSSKFLGRIPKAGTGQNKSRKRAQVSQHRSQAKDMPNSEAFSPQALATTTPPAASYQRPPHVVSCPVLAKKAPPPTSKIIMPQPLSYNKSIIDFDSIPSSEPITTADAFKYNSNGQERSDPAKQKAKSRASNFIVNAIQNSANNSNDRTAALAAALAHPDIQGITKSVGMTDPKKSEMMRNAFNQQQRIIERATEKENTRGRCGDKKRSFVESLFVSMAVSPDQKSGNSKKTTFIDAMGIRASTGYCLMANVEKKRKQLSETIDNVLWKKSKGILQGLTRDSFKIS